MKTYIGYLRVSTLVQEYSIESQRQIVERYVASVGGRLLCSLEERETGKINDRPELLKAIALCKSEKATLCLSRLDRLSRNASFLMSLQDSNLDFICCDMPHADRFTIGILALVAQKEREMISERTKNALKVVKELGIKKIGNPNIAEAQKVARQAIKRKSQAFYDHSLKAIRELQSTGVNSYSKLSRYLNIRREPTPRGGQWTPTQVRRILLTTQATTQTTICTEPATVCV